MGRLTLTQRKQKTWPQGSRVGKDDVCRQMGQSMLSGREDKDYSFSSTVLDLEPSDLNTFVSDCTYSSRLRNLQPQLHRWILP